MLCDSLVRLLRTRAECGGPSGFTFLADGVKPGPLLSLVELDRQARSVAAVLQQRNLAGQRALLCYPPGNAFLAGFFGSLYAGMVAVPVYPPRASPRMRDSSASARVAGPPSS